MPVVSGVNTITDGLIFYVDPTNTNTYSGVGTTAYNLIPGGINNFRLVNGVSYDLDRSGSFYFDGSNDYVGLGSTTIFNSTAFTVSFWIKPTTYSGTVCSGAISNGQYTIFGTSSTYQGYSSTFSGAIQINGGSNSVATVNQSNFSINKWYHYVAVYDSAGIGNSNKFKIYIDGIIKSLTFDTTMPSAPHAAGQEARIGFGPGAPGYPYFNGNIGLVQIHSKALSSTEILQNYNATKARFNTTENIVTDGLVYNLDASNPNSYSGTGTTWIDLVNSGKNGTLTNGPTFSSLNSGTLAFDGSNDYINISATDLLTFGTNPFTIDFWIYITSGSSIRTILSNYDDYNGAYNTYFYIGVYTYDTLVMVRKVLLLDSTGNFVNNTFGADINVNQWAHISFTRDGNTLICYLNGLQISSASKSNNYSGSRASRIGGGVAGISSLAGNLPSLKIYNRTLTASEVLQNYNATKSRYINVLPPVNDSSLVLNLDAGNRASYAGTGTTWFDLSGRGNNFSLINGAYFAGSGITTYMYFDGSNDRAILPGGVNLGTSHTVSVMFKANGVMNSVIFGDIGWSNTGYAFYANNNTLEYAAGNGYNNLTFTSSTNWMYLTVVRNGRSFTFYQNGASLGTLSLTEDSILKLSSLGSYYSGAYTYAGAIAIATCYTRPLTAAEVLQNFNSVRSRYNI